MNNKPKLILINGTTGIGKSTLASRIHDEHPMAFLIEMDAIRRYFSKYKELRKESLLANYDLCKAICEENLKNSRTVIVEKIIPDNDEFIEDLHALGAKYGAQTCEIILNASKDTVVERAKLRGYSDGNSLTPDKVLNFWKQIQELIPRRPDAFVINTDNLDADNVFDLVNKHIS